MSAINEVLVIDSDTTWSGTVTVSADVLILAGATLNIRPGTTVTVLPSESTKTEPEFFSSLTEITVRGALRAVGTLEEPIRFQFQGPQQVGAGGWAGINVDGGTVVLTSCQIRQAESALVVWNGEAVVTDSLLEKNRYGISVLQEKAKVTVTDTGIIANDYGVVLTNNATITLTNSTPRQSEQQDILDASAGGYLPKGSSYKDRALKKAAPYQSESLLGTIVWKEHVVVNGVIRIPPKSRLIIMPGTVVEFTKRDTNGDGIGENGLLVMGMLVAKGTAEQPIIFRSAEAEKNMGDWDALNIFVSDGFQNLIEHCVIKDAYRGMHFHFSNVLVSHADVFHNYRGLQFQESLITISDSTIHHNKSAVRGRDSELLFRNNQVYGNYTGPNIFRITGRLENNVFAGNALDGLRIREGGLVVRRNYFTNNRYGLTVAYANYGTFSDNVSVANHETGITLKGTDNVQVERNFVQANGTNGVSLLNSRAVITGNQISGNGERGVGIISFYGTITGNNLVGNKMYDLGLDGDMDIDASGNYWGKADLDRVIFDSHDDSAKGTVGYGETLADPVPFTWPRADVLTDTVWEGTMLLPPRVKTRATTTLTIRPGSTLKLARDCLFWLEGGIQAIGTAEQRILFTGQEPADGVYWDQITSEMSKAEYAYCDFEHGSMALHSHFSHIEVRNCRFRDNESGFRFRGGPVVIDRCRFENNVYGIVSYIAKGTVTNSIFTNNEMGILVRSERRGGMHIHHNNIVANSRYNIRMGDFNRGGNVDARENWWGLADPTESFFDERREPGIGFVEYEPVAEKAFALDMPHWK